MDKIIRPAARLTGAIEVPGDKSISHRAMILGSLSNGKMTVSNISTAADCKSTRSCLSKLGVKLELISSSEVVIHGHGLYGFKESQNVIDAQNSGTTMRLLSGLLAGQPFYSVMTGDSSLRNRPMKRIISPLSQMGAHILARKNNERPPLTIIGRNLKAIDYSTPVPSAQIKSAILIAGLYCSQITTVAERYLSRDHTERMLKYFGCRIKSANNVTTIQSGKLKAGNIFVPGDISSAIYYIIACLLVPNSKIKISNVGLNPTRMGAVKALIEMGGQINITEKGAKNEEPYGDIEVESTKLKAINIERQHIPFLVDEIPILALAASQAEGKTIISGAEELRFKESDRLKGTASQLIRLGATIKENPDGFEIEGGTSLKGTTVESFGDHRLTMTMAVAGLISEGETKIEGAEAVAVSFPEFFELLDDIR